MVLHDRDLNIRSANGSKGKKGKQAFASEGDKENASVNTGFSESAQSTPSGWKSVASVPRSPMRNGLSGLSGLSSRKNDTSLSAVSPLTEASVSPNNAFFQNIHSPMEGMNSDKKKPESYSSPYLTMKPSASLDYSNSNSKSPLTPIEKCTVRGTKVPINQTRNRHDSWITLGYTAAPSSFDQPSEGFTTHAAVVNSDIHDTHITHDHDSNTTSKGNAARAISPSRAAIKEMRRNHFYALQEECKNSNNKSNNKNGDDCKVDIDIDGLEADSSIYSYSQVPVLATLAVVAIAIICFLNNMNKNSIGIGNVRNVTNDYTSTGASSLVNNMKYTPLSDDSSNILAAPLIMDSKNTMNVNVNMNVAAANAAINANKINEINERNGPVLVFPVTTTSDYNVASVHQEKIPYPVRIEHAYPDIKPLGTRPPARTFKRSRSARAAGTVLPRANANAQTQNPHTHAHLSIPSSNAVPTVPIVVVIPQKKETPGLPPVRTVHTYVNMGICRGYVMFRWGYVYSYGLALYL